jgi:RimJ/RimL family protein N-acetyltransferase
MVRLLQDESLYEFTGGGPATLEELERIYTARATGQSSDRAQGWLNWVCRDRSTREPVGYVQATLSCGERSSAEIAWVTAVACQRRGYASEAAIGMVEWLREHGVDELVAYVHPAHQASIGVARRLGMHPTEDTAGDEVRWVALLA